MGDTDNLARTPSIGKELLGKQLNIRNDGHMSHADRMVSCEPREPAFCGFQETYFEFRWREAESDHVCFSSLPANVSMIGET